MFDKAMKKSVEPYLEPGEELLNVVIVQGKGMTKALLAGGAMTLSAKELLSAVPIADVDSIEVGKAVMTKPVTITVRGEAFQVEAAKAVNTKDFVSAFEQAKARSAVSA